MRTLAPAAALFLLLAACASAPTRPQAGASPTEAVTLRVHNDNWADVTVFLVREGVGIRLGIVDGLGAHTFRVSSAHLGSGSGLALRLETRASRLAFTSLPFDARPGQRVEYRFEASPRPSSPSVF
jgi:hypothetical protein